MSVIEIGAAIRPVEARDPGGVPRPPRCRRAWGRPWWLASAAAGAAFTVALVVVASTTEGRSGVGALNHGADRWWIVTWILHLPYVVILLFLVGGVVERVGYYWRGRAPAVAGRLPTVRSDGVRAIADVQRACRGETRHRGRGVDDVARRSLQRAGSRRLDRR